MVGLPAKGTFAPIAGPDEASMVSVHTELSGPLYNQPEDLMLMACFLNRDWLQTNIGYLRLGSSHLLRRFQPFRSHILLLQIRLHLRRLKLYSENLIL